jgi:hypothetical protein
MLEPRLALAAPVAINDTFSGTEDTPLSINAPGVISNDTDSDAGDVLEAILIGQAARGVVSLQGNGGLVYTPTLSSWGPDKFTYRLRGYRNAQHRTCERSAGRDQRPVHGL